MSRERILLMGSPGSGKSYQLIKIAEYLKSQNKDIYAIDVEDKLEATLEGLGGVPDNLHLWIASDWEDLKKAQSEIEAKIKPDNWVAVDRVDLT